MIKVCAMFDRNKSDKRHQKSDFFCASRPFTLSARRMLACLPGRHFK